MPMFTITDVILIIGTLTTSIVTIINTVKGASDRRVLSDKADSAAAAVVVTGQATKDAAERVATLVQQTNDISDKKLDHITVLTNSQLTKALQRIDRLEKMLEALGASPKAIQDASPTS